MRIFCNANNSHFFFHQQISVFDFLMECKLALTMIKFEKLAPGFLASSYK